MKDFEVLPHTADFKLRVYGSNIPELFTHALIGMFQSIEPRNSSCTIKNNLLVCPELPKTQKISLTAPDATILLVDFLSEALYLSDIHNEAYLAVTIIEFKETAHEAVINAQLHGISVTGFGLEIKAVTYHNLNFEKKNSLWYVDIVFDV